MTFAIRLSAPQTVQALALFAALSGAVVWSALLLTSAESRAPSVAPSAPAQPPDNPALQWFANQPAHVDIKVSGVMAAGRGAVAILSLNDGPARSFLVGERLSPGVRLVAIEEDGVIIERGTEQLTLKVNKLSDSLMLPAMTRP